MCASSPKYSASVTDILRAAVVDLEACSLSWASYTFAAPWISTKLSSCPLIHHRAVEFLVRSGRFSSGEIVGNVFSWRIFGVSLGVVPRKVPLQGSNVGERLLHGSTLPGDCNPAHARCGCLFRCRDLSSESETTAKRWLKEVKQRRRNSETKINSYACVK